MYSLHARVIYTIYRALSYLLLRRIQNTPHCFLEHTQNSTHQRTYSENSITSDFKIVLRVWARVWKKLNNFGASSSDVNKLSRLISVNHSIVSGTFFHLPLNKVSAWNHVSHHSDFSLIDSCCINPIDLLYIYIGLIQHLQIASLKRTSCHKRRGFFPEMVVLLILFKTMDLDPLFDKEKF